MQGIQILVLQQILKMQGITKSKTLKKQMGPNYASDSHVTMDPKDATGQHYDMAEQRKCSLRPSSTSFRTARQCASFEANDVACACCALSSTKQQRVSNLD